MSVSRSILATGEIYHIFNKAVGNETIFKTLRELSRTLGVLDFYRFPQEIKYSKYRQLNKETKAAYWSDTKKLTPFVEIYCYSFMPNHYHFLLKQIKDNGIYKFISNFQNSYAKYFNTKEERTGSLFLNPFKSLYIETDEDFIHLSRYIHLNPVTSFLIEIEDLPSYPFNSFRHYVLKSDNSFINTDFLLDFFKGSFKGYEEFVKSRVDYQRALNKIKHLMLN